MYIVCLYKSKDMKCPPSPDFAKSGNIDVMSENGGMPEECSRTFTIFTIMVHANC